MNLLRMKKFGFSAAVIVIVSFVIWQLFRVMTFAEPLTIEDATNKIQNLYSGKIVKAIDKQEAYEITMELNTGTYELILDRETGNVISMIRAKKKVNQNIEESIEQPSSPEKSSSKQITKKEAVEIALKKISGVVDDIDIEQLDGVTYYFIEIEKENGEDGTVQINAITGEVKSISWDD